MTDNAHWWIKGGTLRAPPRCRAGNCNKLSRCHTTTYTLPFVPIIFRYFQLPTCARAVDVVLYSMTKNKTIYLAKITKLRDYESDITLEMEAFDSLEKAEAFLKANNMVEGRFGWTSKISMDLDASIIELEVK
jgi:hypothetical protein